jgi:hypothetical protein
MARVPVDATPIGQRDAGYLIGIEANWDNPAGDEANVTWTRELAAALAPYSTGASDLNFEDTTEVPATKATHGPNDERLVTAKRRSDSENLVRSRRGLLA